MRMKMTLALAVVGALFAAGCGDDDSDDADAEASAPPITKEEWVAEANRICRASNKEMEARGEEFFENEEGSEQDFQRDVVVPGIGEQVSGVKALGAPEGDEVEVEAIIEAAEAGLGEAESDPTVVDSESGPLAEASRLIVEYGATACG